MIFVIQTNGFSNRYSREISICGLDVVFFCTCNICAFPLEIALLPSVTINFKVSFFLSFSPLAEVEISVTGTFFYFVRDLPLICVPI